jgi:hypothetical protein
MTESHLGTSSMYRVMVTFGPGGPENYPHAYCGATTERQRAIEALRVARENPDYTHAWLESATWKTEDC